MLNELRGSFTANSDHVAAKVIDGELIIIRLSDGTYYSMDNAGARVWALIEAGTRLRTWCGSSRAGMEQRRIVSKAMSPHSCGNFSMRASSWPVRRANGGPGAAPADLEPYETPTLHIYRDMGNLLALDPPTPGIDDLMLGNG
jgi:hypothetical protein